MLSLLFPSFTEFGKFTNWGSNWRAWKANNGFWTGSDAKRRAWDAGIPNINFSEEKKNDTLFSEFPEKLTSLQWHSYEVQNLENNKDVTHIASSDETKYQIFRYKNHAYGIQFHIEIKDTTVNDWGCVPEYKMALEKQLGEGALEKFDFEAKKNMKKMNNYSEILYTKFKNEIILNN